MCEVLQKILKWKALDHEKKSHATRDVDGDVIFSLSASRCL
jgi:hypothetical protein